MAFGMRAGMLAAVAVDVRLRTSEVDGDTKMAYPRKGVIPQGILASFPPAFDLTRRPPAFWTAKCPGPSVLGVRVCEGGPTREGTCPLDMTN